MGHQAEHGNRGKAHCPAHDRHADLLEGIEQVQHGPGFFRGHAHQGNANNDGEDHHLEHLAFNHGIERVAGQKSDQGLGQLIHARHGGNRHTVFPGRNGSAEPCHHSAGVDQVADPETYRCCHGRRDYEKAGYPQAELSQLFKVFAGGEPANHRGNHQRDYDHLNGGQEQLPRESQPVTDQRAGVRFHESHGGAEERARNQPQEHANEHL